MPRATIILTMFVVAFGVTTATVANASPQTCRVVEGSMQQHLVAVRVGHHDSYDQMTFEFAEDDGVRSSPTYVLSPVDEVRADGSGLHVDMAGDHLYQLALHGASNYDPDPQRGPRQFQPGFPTLVDARQVGDFEAVVSWGIGVVSPICPIVAELQNPPRLVLKFPPRLT